MADIDPHYAVEFRGLTKQYDGANDGPPVLADVDLAVPGGQFLALVGASGSGKSTLLNLAAGIDQPTHGEALLDGHSLGRMTERERTLARREKVGFVFQFFNLVPGLTVEQNLLLPLELTRVPRHEARGRVADVLDGLGLAGKAGRKPDTLSGGEQQRVAVARAVIHRPAVVLADEPTGNLDTAAGADVLALLQHMTKELGAAVLMATHSRDAAGRADRILAVSGGSVASVCD